MAMSQPELARRLKAAREAAGLTQEEVAKAIDVPRPGITQMEAGKRSVSGIELDKLAGLYGLDVRSLLAGGDADVDGLAARFRSDGALVDRPDVLAALQKCLQVGRELAGLEAIVGLERRPATVVYGGPPTSIFSAISQGARAAEDERRRHGFGDGPVEDLIDFLENHGVRTAIIDLPPEVSGLMLVDPGAGPLVVANQSQYVLRRTFSFAHEYAHVLFDRDARGLVSRSGDGANLTEVRANAFAGGFLMPEAGIRRMLAEFGKSTATRLVAEGSGGEDAGLIEGRSGDSVPIRIHDLALLADHFRVTRPAMLTRLRATRIVTERQSEDLRARNVASGPAIARVLGLREVDHGQERERFSRRFIRLALEAYERKGISRGKLVELLTGLLDLDQGQVDDLLKTSVHAPSAG